MELMAYLALFGMIMSVMYSVYYQFSRTMSAADRTLLKERSGFDLVRRMQDDIRRSNEIANAFESFRASDGFLILMVDGDQVPEKQVIIYKYAESRKTLMRYQMAADDPAQGVSSRSLGHGIEDFDFSVDQHAPKLVKVSILVKEGPLGTLRNRPLSFHVSMRNG
jgi:hypothetical protein